MNIKKYKVLGIMSGTSCDGLDIAYCEYWGENNKWNYKLLNFPKYNIYYFVHFIISFFVILLKIKVLSMT